MQPSLLDFALDLALDAMEDYDLDPSTKSGMLGILGHVMDEIAENGFDTTDLNLAELKAHILKL
jgi:hypothetical protein